MLRVEFLNRSAIVAALLVAGLAAPVATGEARAQIYGEPSYVRISRHRSKVVRIPRPAETVVVGNPDIADVVLQDSTTLVLTGKVLGETNLIILDEDGDPIVDETIVVGVPTATAVTIYRPAGRANYRCSPDCAANPDGSTVQP